ncbi:MAG: hypothetical protein MUE49_07515 [Rhodospirillales bacterium]|nr:hypothetical protein [Rhodospirillales bacterium]
MSRTEVEAKVGAPRTERALACGSVAVYTFDRGRKAYQSNIDVAGAHPAAPILAGLISHPFLVAGQRGELDVVYGPDGRVLHYAPGRQTDWPRAAAENGLADDRPTPDVLARRYYQAGMAAMPDAAGWGCLCLAAHLGNADAQRQMARSYRYGSTPVSTDAVAALTWSLIADGQGGGSPETAAIAATLSESEVAAAHASVATWQPDTAACRRTVDAVRDRSPPP